MKDLILIGAGGHASVCLEIAELHGFNVKGYLAPSKSEHFRLQTLEWLGNDTKIDQNLCENFEFINGIGSTGNPSIRISAFQRVTSMRGSFRTLIHPNAILSKYVKLGHGVQIFAGVIINSGAQIGDNVILNTGSLIEHDCKIENHAHIAPRSTVLGGVTVSEESHIGAGATILQNLTIAKKTLVGAQALVTRNFPEQKKLMGCPARES